MSRLFNISSAGSTASAWLTVNLNKHRLITAFHGMRTNPFGRQLIYPSEMVKGLRNFSECLNTAQYSEANQSGETTAMGIIHTYYGPQPRQAFLQCGGGFMAIIRDPVMRVNSQFLAHYPDHDAYSVAINGQLSDVKNVFPGFKRDTTKILSPAEEQFLTLSEAAIINDVSNYQNCPPQEIILFEEMVSCEQYCFDKLSALTGVDDQELKNIIVENMSVKTNIHTSKVQTSSAIFDSWPEQFKYLFLSVMHGVGLDTCLGTYNDLGYNEAASAISSYKAQG